MKKEEIALIGIALLALGGGISFLQRREPTFDEINVGGRIIEPSRQLTTEEITSVEQVISSEVITPELIMPIQPYIEPAIVTTEVVPTATLTERADWTGRFYCTFSFSSGQFPTDILTAIMKFRDEMRPRGMGKGIMYINYASGQKEEKLIYA